MIHPGCSFRMSFTLSFVIVLGTFIQKATSLGASSDTYTWGGDYMRSGYQVNHNMDPAVVGSPNFGQIFNIKLPGNFHGIGAEQIYSQPLVFTSNDGVQYLYIATTQNNIYKLNAKTGAIVASRNLHVPFLTADLDNCVDINPTIGVTATGTIDPTTGVWYLTSKTYSQQFQNGNFGPTNTPGLLNGRYYFHGIDTQSTNLTDAFDPVLLDGRVFRNNANRMFIGGHQHSRPALVIAGDYVYTGYASHCVLYNFTGAIIGHNKKTGAVVEMYAMEGGPEPNTVRGGGVWMSGGGIAYDGSSLFFTTGNGYASQLANTPIPGRQPPSALEEAAINAKLNDDGTINVIDFFMPWEKVQLDGADKDLGTTPLELLPSHTFTCSNVKRMGVVTGKSGKTYVLNLDNLGGYQMGANKLDNVVFTYQNENSVYAGAGVMPLGGGYIYINVIGYRTRVFKFSCDSTGNPQFTVVAYTAEVNAYVLGTGHGTTTSLNGQDGTGLYWVVDVAGVNLRIYDATPPSGGNLTLINSFNAPGITKFTRATFGNGLVYLGTTTGNLYAFGSPVNLPLNCSSPYHFGTVSLKNTSAPLTINCTANIATTVTGIGLNGNTNFNLSSLPPGNLRLDQGVSFSFQATFNPQSVGPLSSDAFVSTTNGVTGYSTSTPVTLDGTGNSAAPFLQVGPNTLSFNVMAGQQTGGVNESSIWSNVGDSLLTIQAVRYSLTSERGPWVTPNISSTGGVEVGPFTFIDVPTTIAADGQTTITVNYNPRNAGNDGCYISIASDGGTSILDVVAVAGTYPQALIEFQNYNGSGWVTLDPSKNFTFGNVTENLTKYLQLRVTNNGSSTAVALSITVSKPPYGIPGIVGAVNDVDLTEGTLLAAGQSATASLYCSVPKSQVNIPSYLGMAQWIMNTGDPKLGKQFMNFTCNAVAEQVGPLYTNQSAQFGYIGCYLDNNPGRQMAVQAYGDSNNSNDRCINTCAASGWLYAATSYQQECWCGGAVPITKNADADCNYGCTGNVSETCGGNGYFHDHARLSVFANLSTFVNATSPPLSIPASVGEYKYIGCYAESGGKALNAKSTTDTKGMTVETCAIFCSSYLMFSLEFAQECYCGNSIIPKYASLTLDSNCQTMTCKGNNSEFCGAGNYGQIYALNGVKSSITSTSSSTTSTGSSTSVIAASTVVSFSLADYTYLGCYNETHDRRALDAAGQDVSTNTLNSCAAFCKSYDYFGVEYSSQCYCAQTLYVNSIRQSTDAGCNMECAGNSSQTCGGPDFLNIYHTNHTVSPGASTTAQGTTKSIETGVPQTVASVGNFMYIGCYNEVDGRALSAASVSNSSMSVEICATFCATYQYFSVEYASECYCGNSIGTGSMASSSGSCTMNCAGNPNEYCGGAGWMNMYQNNRTSTATSSGFNTASSLALSPSVTTAPPRIGNYTSLGCWTDNVSGRALPNEYTNSSMSLNICASYAQAATARYFGAEYGIECWYGQTLAGGNTAASQSKCNMNCPGNTSEWCGAGNYLQIYSFNAVSVILSTSSTVSSTSSEPIASIASSGSSTPLSLRTSISGVVGSSSTASGFPTPRFSEVSSNLVSQTSASTTTLSASPSFSSVFASSTKSTISSTGQPSSSVTVAVTTSGSSSVVEVSSSLISVSQSISITSRAFGSGNQIPASSNVAFSSLVITIDPVQHLSGATSSLSSFISSTSSILATSSFTSSASSRLDSVSTSPSQTSTSLVPTSSPTDSSSAVVSIVSDSSTASIGSRTTGTNIVGVTTLTNLATSSASSLSLPSFSSKSTVSSTSVGPRFTSSIPRALSVSTLTSSRSTQSASTHSLSSLASFSVSGSASVSQSLSKSLSPFLSTSTSLTPSSHLSSAISTIAGSNSRSVGTFTPQSSIVLVSTLSRSHSSTSITSVRDSSSSRLSSLSRSGSTSSGPTALATVSSYTYQGCYDEVTARAFNATYLINKSGMTVPMCAAYCSAYAYFGVEYATECFCGPFPRPGSTKVASQSDCKMSCAGDRTTLCGGANRLSVYNSSDPAKINHVPVSPQSVNGYRFYSCVLDSPRLLKTKLLSTSSMNVEMCLQAAGAKDYKYAGLEYGKECWAGSSLQHSLHNATTSACSMVCAGNVGELCGAALRMSLYIRGT